jgi:PBCV-specific basic adaptor domain
MLAVQTGPTCWLYSNLNTLLLSKYGRRLLFKYMVKYYNELTVINRVKFTSGPTYKCTRIQGLRKFFFYKFVYDFWFHNIQGAKGASPNLYKNITNFEMTTKYGSHPSSEREIILTGLGIPYTINTGTVKNVPVFIKRSVYEKDVLRDTVANITYNGYKLDNALITMYTPLNKTGHAIAGIITPDGDFMVVDSNNRSFKHDWVHNLQGILAYYPKYKLVYYTSIMYIKDEELPNIDKSAFTSRAPIDVNSKGGGYVPIVTQNDVNSKGGGYVPIVTQNDVNSKGRKIYTGDKGGRYVLIGTRKQYIKKRQLPQKEPTNVNSKGRKIYTGDKGGRYVLIGNRKQYIKTQREYTNVNSKGRKIHTGDKGGRYVLIGNRKQYLKK